MFFSLTLYVAIIVCVVGIFYRIWTWCQISVGSEAAHFSPKDRAVSALKGIFQTIFSRKIIVLLKVLILDVILQLKLLRDDFQRWIMHICLYFGFILLLWKHGPRCRSSLRTVQIGLKTWAL